MPPMSTINSYPTWQYRQVVDYLNEGHTVVQAANRFNCSVSRVYNCAKYFGIRAGPGRNSGHWAKVLVLLCKGHSQAETARALGITRERVRQIYNQAVKAGLKINVDGVSA